MKHELNYVALGARVRKARIRAGLTQEKLGEICNLSTAYIGHIERGTRIPSVETLFRLSHCLHISCDELLLDSQKSNELLNSVSAQLGGRDTEQVQHFLSVVRILADHIEQLE